jgi:hypothetical protein
MGVQTRRVQKPVDELDVPGLKWMGGDVVGEDTAEEEGQVAEPPADARALRFRNDLEQLSQPHGVELAVAPTSPPPCRPLPHASARHVRVGRQELGQE